MKKLLFIFIACFLFSCDMSRKEYQFNVQYFNGDRDTIYWVGQGENRFLLKGGDLTLCRGENNSKTIASGIRTFDVISIAKVSDQYKEKK